MAQGIVVQSPSTCSNPSNYIRSSTTGFGLPSPCLSPVPNSLSAAPRKLSLFSRCNSSVQRRSESTLLCTNPDCVDVAELSMLLAATRQNCEQFPRVLNDGSIVPVNTVKLRRALQHSTVVAALYVEGHEPAAEPIGSSPEKLDDGRPGGGGWLDYWMPQPPRPKTLVAFGRATSDHTLTASIYDLVVAPPYQRSGYGSRVLLRIVRDLRRLGISDIAATPVPELRPFFQRCGFAPDTLMSVTMMYTRSASSTAEFYRIRECGRKFLLIPPSLPVEL